MAEAMEDWQETQEMYKQDIEKFRKKEQQMESKRETTDRNCKVETEAAFSKV